MEYAAHEPARDGGDVTIDLRAFEVDVPLPGGDVVRVDPREHRADVVRRLLLLGATERNLTTLLPDWDELVRLVAVDLRTEGLM
jgi:hypothetical protein